MTTTTTTTRKTTTGVEAIDYSCSWLSLPFRWIGDDRFWSHEHLSVRAIGEMNNNKKVRSLNWTYKRMYCICYTIEDIYIYNQTNILLYSRFAASLLQSHVLSTSSSFVSSSSSCFQGHTRARNYSCFFFNNAPCRKT
jgi:hypothetical protein